MIKIGQEFAFFFAVFILPIIGGLFNRVHGGWLDVFVDSSDSGNSFYHNFVSRVVYALPTALFILGLLLIPKKRKKKMEMNEMIYKAKWAGAWQMVLWAICFAIYSFALLFFGLFVEETEYRMMGRNSAATSSSTLGPFDWLIGREQPSWKYWRRWFMSFSGMSIRGLLQTVPIGMALVFFECGPEFLLSGLQKGLIYEVGWNIPSHISNFSQGAEAGEFCWGYWQWFVILAALNSFRPKTKFSSRLGHFIYISFCAVCILVFLASSIIFPIQTSTDELRNVHNRWQTFLGVSFATIFSSIVLGLHVRKYWSILCGRYVLKPGPRSSTSSLNDEMNSGGNGETAHLLWDPNDPKTFISKTAADVNQPLQSSVVKYMCAIIRIWNVLVTVLVVTVVLMNLFLRFSGPDNDEMP